MSAFNFAKEKKALLENLQHLKSLAVKDVREYTFQKKHDEIQSKIKTDRQAIHRASGNIWCLGDFQNEQTTVAHIENLKPKVIIADDKALVEYWNTYRLFVSSAESYPTPGRFIKFFVVDTNVGDTTNFGGITWLRWPSMMPWPVLGIGAISSDLPALGDRDKSIGWTREQRHKRNSKHAAKSRNTAIGSTIVPMQPFGWNFNGGKLIASLITSEVIRNEWQLRYGDVLAGMSTTALYGRKECIYDGLECWKHIGFSKGSVTIQPKPAIYKQWLKYIKMEKAEEYDETMEQEEGVNGPVTNYKAKALTMIYEAAGIDENEFKHGFERKVYFSSFYENTNEFLCCKIDESELKLNPLFEGGVDSVMKWWRPQAIGRYKMLKKQGRLKLFRHFYNHLGHMDYETAKENFFADVGR